MWGAARDQAISLAGLKPPGLSKAGVRSISCEFRRYFPWRVSLVCSGKQLFIRSKCMGRVIPWASQPGEWCLVLYKEKNKL